jgi:hypothetical protein
LAGLRGWRQCAAAGGAENGGRLTAGDQGIPEKIMRAVDFIDGAHDFFG